MKNLFRVFQRAKAFVPSLSPKHRQWCPESSSETSWLLIFDTKSVSQWKPAWAILSQWFFSGAKKNHYLSIFWLLNKAVFLQYGRPGFDPWVWKEMVTHCSILGWRISWTEESGGLQSTGLQRVRRDWVTNTFHPQTRLLIPKFLKIKILWLSLSPGSLSGSTYRKCGRYRNQKSGGRKSTSRSQSMP